MARVFYFSFEEDELAKLDLLENNNICKENSFTKLKFYLAEVIQRKENK